ncbi:MAG TPA: hypothetical protein VM841_07655 [Actinomycetota bacterium]|nr:hypothetical protein [Actinomycetota bacterium]
MEKSILENLEEGDPVSVALRGGAGWVHGSMVWRRDGMMLIESADDAVRKETPFVLILLDEVSAVAIPSKVDPPGSSRSPGFNR